LATANVRTYLWLATTTGLMQLCTIVVLAGFQVGYALALFQTSTLVSVLLGWRVFREGNIGERLVGSVVMVAGAVLIVVGR
jgi:drug/metabolite transporter (DMT)-like permease